MPIEREKPAGAFPAAWHRLLDQLRSRPDLVVDLHHWHWAPTVHKTLSKDECHRLALLAARRFRPFIRAVRREGLCPPGTSLRTAIRVDRAACRVVLTVRLADMSAMSREIAGKIADFIVEKGA